MMVVESELMVLMRLLLKMVMQAANDTAAVFVAVPIPGPPAMIVFVAALLMMTAVVADHLANFAEMVGVMVMLGAGGPLSGFVTNGGWRGGSLGCRPYPLSPRWTWCFWLICCRSCRPPG